MKIEGGGANIIPTQCPKFLAACATIGIELEKGKGISNAYDIKRKYDPEEPGTVSYLLSRDRFNPLAVAKVWLSPDQDMAEAEALPQRMIKARTEDDWLQIADDLDALHVWSAVGHMRLFSIGKFAIDSRSVSDAEERAAADLSSMPETIRRAQKRNGGKIAARLSEAWKPAMFAWVKAWIFNYLELREIWKVATPSVKIEREDRFPIIIPKGKDFNRLVRKWVR